MGSKKPSRFYGINSESASERQGDDFELRTYLEENYTLFALVGIFGAIAVYLNQLGAAIGDNADSLRIGVTGSIIIVLLIVGILGRDALDRFGGMDGLFDIFLSSQNQYRSLVLFAIPFGGVVYTFILIVGNFSISLSILLQFGAMVLGFIGASKLHHIVLEEFELVLDQTNFFKNGIRDASYEVFRFGILLSLPVLFSNELRKANETNFTSSEIVYFSNGDILSTSWHGFVVGMELFFIITFSMFGTAIISGNLSSAMMWVKERVVRLKSRLLSVYSKFDYFD